MAAVSNNSFLFQFEKKFNRSWYKEYMQQHWHDSFMYAAIYILLVFSGKKWMENRPRYELRSCLVLWSAALGIFSIFGAVRVVPQLIFSAYHHGKEYSLCSSVDSGDAFEFWRCLFVFSKVVELGDTVFVVLRKQKLIFLHWYHHATVLIYTWSQSFSTVGYCKWFIGMNYTVHSVMYNYYGLRAMKFHVPKIISMLITSLQLTQMIAGSVISGMAFQMSRRGVDCGETDQGIIYGILMYVSYFVLFANFFYTTYLGEKPKLSTTGKSEWKKRN